MKNNETPDILSRIRNMKFRKELTALLAFFVMISTSYAMIHPGEALNNNVARSFMFFNEEEASDETAVPDINALLDADKNSGETEDTEPAGEVTEEVLNEETASAVPQEQSTSAPTSTPAEIVVPTLEPTSTPANTAAATAEATGTPETLASADPEESAGTETAEPENSPSASPETTVSAEQTGTPDAAASAESSLSSTPEAEEEDWHFANWVEEDGEENKPEVIVTVEAPYGAFPEGTTMEVTIIKELDEKTQKQVEDKLEEENKEAFVNVTKIQAVDIVFKDAEGNEIEPAEGFNIKVSMRSTVIKKAAEETKTDTQLIHIKEDKETKETEAVTVEHKDATAEDTAEDEIQFETDSFSMYVFVESETLETKYITAEGESYTITVTYGKDAEIPDGSVLEVSEISNGTKGYADYVEQAANALTNEGEETPLVNSVRLFDISIVSEGQKVEPKTSVEVKIAYAKAESLGETSEVNAVHFGEEKTEVLNVNVQGNEEQVEGVTFTAESFSVYAVVIIDKEAGTFVFDEEDYKITVTYTKEANIPIGTELIVKEITPDEDLYWKLRNSTVEKINEGVKWEDTELTPDPRKGISDAVFFDISLVNAGTEIEPDIPLQVKIEYKEGGVLVPESESTQIIHFAKNETEIIEDVDVQYSDDTEEEGKVAVSYEYEQSSFSAVGSYSTGKYIDINDSNIIKPSAGIMAAPILRAAGDSSITASKNISDDDNDGVYDLTLSVTGQSEQSSSTSVNKSNVVIVVDVSGSMDTDTYSKYTGEGTSSGDYYGKTDNSYYRVYWRNPGGGYRWQYIYNYRYYDYTGDVYFEESRLDATKHALKELVSALLANNKDEVKDGVNLNDILEITLVKFADPVENIRQGWNGTSTLIRNVNTEAEKSQINTIIDGLWAGGGTNWERALQVAKDEADTYKRNQPDEPVSVIFMTDGVPTMWGTNPNNGGSENIDNTHKAWNEADDDARAIVSAGYTLYNIFAFGTDTQKYDRDGGRTDADYLRSLTNYAYSGTGTYENTTLSTAAKPYFFNASDTTALQDAFNAIIDSISGNVGYGGVMVDDGVTTGVTSTSVTVDGSVNTDKFKYSIKNGYSTLATVHIEGNNATFTVNGTDYPATRETVTTDINGTTHTNTVYSVTVGDKVYKMSPASFDNNGKIQWDLAGIGIIENGYTYELQFEVWPNQLSYDMVADLNNGVKTLDQIKTEVIASQGQAVWDQIEKALVSLGNGKYAIRTNYEQYVDYYTVDTQTNEQTGETTTTYTEQPRKELGPKDPVDLTSSTMNLRKLWDDSLDQDQFDELLWKDITRNAQGEIADQSAANSLGYSVKLHVWKADTLSDLNNQINSYADAVGGSYAQADEHDYLDKTLGWTGSSYDWDDSLEVAPGTMIEISKAREMGIDVTKHTQVTFGSKTYLVLESGHYYTVTEESIDRHFELNTIVYHPMLVDGVLSNVTFKEDGTVDTIVPMSTVDATNTLKGGINVQKKVFDGEGNEVTEVIVSDDTFKVRISMNNSDGSPYENWDYRIYYGQNNPNASAGRSDHNYGPAGNGGIIETDLYIGDVIRIINIPAGVTYSVQETEYDDTVYTLATNYTFPLTTGGAEKSFTTDGTGVSYMISKGENDNFVVDTNKKVVGNAASQAIVVNKIPTARIKLLKVGDTTTPLDGVQFKIFYDEACTKPVTKDATGQPIPGMNSDGIITTDTNGYADLGTLSGTYYFQEVTTKAGYNILAAPVLVKVEKDANGEKVTASCSQEGVIFNTPGWIAKGEDGIWVVKVNNSTGAVLPMTGGSGTLPYTLGGITVMLTALMYGFRMRRRERRLN